MVHIIVVVILATGAHYFGKLDGRPFQTLDECQAYMETTNFHKDMEILLRTIPHKGPTQFKAAASCREDESKAT